VPIPRKALEAAQRPLSERILTFLKAHPNEAFNIVEIYSAVEGYEASSAAIILLMMTEDRDGALRPFHDAVSRLVKDGAVVVGQHQQQPYYAATQ
jgi:hypothetical protein